MTISDEKTLVVQKVIEKITNMPVESVTKVLIFMAGMDAEQNREKLNKHIWNKSNSNNNVQAV